MEQAKIHNGQIKIPEAIQKKLNIQEGDHIVFLEDEHGKIVLINSAKTARDTLIDEATDELITENLEAFRELAK